MDKTEFDAMQTATLENIACQDALEGGEAVYSARIMLRMEGCFSSARLAGNNESFSKNETMQNLQTEEKTIGEIFPNPNTGEFSLKYVLASEEKGELRIFDLNGKLLYKQFLPQNKNQIEINHLKLNAGVYFYCITLNEIPILNQKLIVIQ